MIRKKLGEVITPTSVVLLQELERFNKLIKRMAVSLNSLQKVGRVMGGEEVEGTGGKRKCGCGGGRTRQAWGLESQVQE